MSKSDEQEAKSRLADGAQPAPPPPHAVELRGDSAPPPKFADLHGCRVAVDLSVGADERVVEGMAHCGEDAQLVKVLRVVVDDEADLEILLVEGTFGGSLVRLTGSKCTFLICAGTRQATPESLQELRRV